MVFRSDRMLNETNRNIGTILRVSLAKRSQG